MTNRTYADLVADARNRVPEVTPREAMQLRASGADPVLVDCREPNEFALGCIPGAALIPRGVLEQNIERVAARDRKVIIYCASGNRSLLAGEMLQAMGYTDVASMSGGFRGWVEAGGDVDG